MGRPLTILGIVSIGITLNLFAMCIPLGFYVLLGINFLVTDIRREWAGYLEAVRDEMWPELEWRE